MLEKSTCNVCMKATYKIWRGPALGISYICFNCNLIHSSYKSEKIIRVHESLWFAENAISVGESCEIEQKYQDWVSELLEKELLQT